jgi:hypothetical protein
MSNLIDTDANVFTPTVFGAGDRRIITTSDGIYTVFKIY